jgi:small subunit ribosomal protein S17
MKKIEIGIISSDKLQKSRIILTEQFFFNLKYKKKIRKLKKYIVHDELNISKIGDIVLFKRNSKLNGNKNWEIVKVI